MSDKHGDSTDQNEPVEVPEKPDNTGTGEGDLSDKSADREIMVNGKTVKLTTDEKIQDNFGERAYCKNEDVGSITTVTQHLDGKTWTEIERLRVNKEFKNGIDHQLLSDAEDDAFAHGVTDMRYSMEGENQQEFEENRKFLHGHGYNVKGGGEAGADGKYRGFANKDLSFRKNKNKPAEDMDIG